MHNLTFWFEWYNYMRGPLLLLFRPLPVYKVFENSVLVNLIFLSWIPSQNLEYINAEKLEIRKKS